MTRDELAKHIEDLQQAREQHAHSLHELYARAWEMHPFAQRGMALQAAITSEEAYAEITKLGTVLFPTDAGTLYLRSTTPAEDSLDAVASWPVPPGKSDSFTRNDCWALRSGNIHWVDRDCDAPCCKHLSLSSCSSYVCVPM